MSDSSDSSNSFGVFSSDDTNYICSCCGVTFNHQSSCPLYLKCCTYLCSSLFGPYIRCRYCVCLLHFESLEFPEFEEKEFEEEKINIENLIIKKCIRSCCIKRVSLAYLTEVKKFNNNNESKSKRQKLIK